MANLEGATLKGNYYLRRKLNSGGMADVYEAWDQVKSAPVAVKVMRSDRSGDPEWRAAFLKEADWLKQLEHPYIVRCYGMERDGSLEFLVMDWIDGRDLHQAIVARGGPFSLSEIITVLDPVCSALHFTHLKGIFHCDIKPANILLAANGSVLLTDFSVARLGGASQSSGGTPIYMAPEQIAGQAVTPRTDVYGLGITLYELLSGGTMPFRGDSPESSRQGGSQRDRVEWEQRHLPPPPVTLHNPHAPPGAVQVVEQALSKDPSRRFPGALAFLNALSQADTEPARRETVRQSDLMNTEYRRPMEPSSPRRDEPQPKPIDGQAPVRRPAGPMLVCRDGPLAGQMFPLRGERVSIGRMSDNQVVLPDPGVSRRHVTLILGRKAIYLQDEGSTAGTYLNGERLLPQTPTPLQPGDVIHLGPSWAFEFFSH